MLRFREWTQRLDVAELRRSSRARTWLTAAYPTWLLTVALGAWIPGTREALGLNPWPTLAVIAVQSLVGVAYWLSLPADRFPLRSHALLLVGSGLMHVGLALAAASSAQLGTWVYGSLWLITVATHARAYRVTLDAPWGALLPVAGAAASLAWNPSAGNAAALAVMLPAALFTSFTLGTDAQRGAERQLQTLQVEQALAAQQLEIAHTNSRSLERKVVDLLGANHDIKNLLSTAVLNAASLRRELEADGSEGAAAHLSRLDKLQQALSLVAAVARTSRDAATSSAAPDAPVSLADALAGARARFLERWPACALVLPAQDAAVVMPGGKASLERVLDNLLANAAEGDGTRGASRVEVTAYQHGTWLRLTVEDDGPGFPPELLRPAAGQSFPTTKRHGMGLGLVTVASLVAAARGEFARSNRAGGGARVEVVLPALATKSGVTEAS